MTYVSFPAPNQCAHVTEPAVILGSLEVQRSQEVLTITFKTTRIAFFPLVSRPVLPHESSLPFLLTTVLPPLDQTLNYSCFYPFLIVPFFSPLCYITVLCIFNFLSYLPLKELDQKQPEDERENNEARLPL